MPSSLRSGFARGAFFLFLTLSIASCTAPAFDAVCRIPADATPEQQVAALCACQSGIAESRVSGYRRKKLDLLVVVGNTPGMVSKQQALAQALAWLPDLFAAHDYDYHIGVVSTDVGSWTAADTPWTMSAGSCDSFAGDDGRLQATSCLDRRDVSAAAGGACATLCPGRQFLPADGRSYIARENGKNNVPSFLEPDPQTGRLVDRGPEYALKCMALLGDAGCALSAPLESARRALDGHLLTNRDFLRPDAVLAVLFLTDTDDCSIALDRRADNDPHTQSCGTPDFNAAASCYGLGPYRCLARDVACDQPMNVAGAKSNCRERPDSALESVDTYARFFASLHARYSILPIGIWTLPALPGGGKLVVEQDPKVSGSAGLVLGRGGNAGCQSTATPLLTGAAELRLSRFMDALNRELGASPRNFFAPTNVCDTATYSQALAPFDDTIATRGLPSCLPGLPQLWPDGSPKCLVGNVPDDSFASTPEVLMPLCGTSCCAAFADSGSSRAANDPAIPAACAAEPADCYCAVPAKIPWVCRDSALLGVWRKDNADAPPDSAVSVRCAMQCPLTRA